MGRARLSTESKILVTGAAGYIGSHTVLALSRAGKRVVAVDDYSNSDRRVPARLAPICPTPVEWLELDVRDCAALDGLLATRKIDGAIHFAGRKSVSESCRDPLGYYDSNMVGSLRLVECLRRHRVARLVFSSSATVYDASQPSPVNEASRLSCASPYGRSKLHVEQMLEDIARADGKLRCASLRYFNPVGADATGLIGESPIGPPANLMPAICQAAAGASAGLVVHGNDYPTRDGTGVRDFVHVDDVARAHLAALDQLAAAAHSFTLNIGTGRGYSVLEMIAAFETVNGVAVPFRIAGRRDGDVAELYADVSAARRELGWRAEQSLEAMCRDAWRWQSKQALADAA